MAIKEHSTKQDAFEFYRVLPPDKSLTVDVKRQEKKSSRGPQRLANAVAKIPTGPSATDPINITPPKIEAKATVVDEKSAAAVGLGIELGTWDRHQGRFSVARAWLNGRYVSRRRTIVLAAVAITVLGAVTSTYWRPYAVSALEAGRAWTFGGSTVQAKPKVAPRTVQKRYQCWFFGWHPCK